MELHVDGTSYLINNYSLNIQWRIARSLGSIGPRAMAVLCHCVFIPKTAWRALRHTNRTNGSVNLMRAGMRVTFGALQLGCRRLSLGVFERPKVQSL